MNKNQTPFIMQLLKHIFLYSMLAFTFLACSENEPKSSPNSQKETNSSQYQKGDSNIVGAWETTVNGGQFNLNVTIDGQFVIVRGKHDRWTPVQEAGVYHANFTKLTGGGGLVYIKRTDQLFYNDKEFSRSN